MTKKRLFLTLMVAFVLLTGCVRTPAAPTGTAEASPPTSTPSPTSNPSLPSPLFKLYLFADGHG